MVIELWRDESPEAQTTYESCELGTAGTTIAVLGSKVPSRLILVNHDLSRSLLSGVTHCAAA
jgi:hypothetical protein